MNQQQLRSKYSAGYKMNRVSKRHRMKHPRYVKPKYYCILSPNTSTTIKDADKVLRSRHKHSQSNQNTKKKRNYTQITIKDIKQITVPKMDIVAGRQRRKKKRLSGGYIKYLSKHPRRSFVHHGKKFKQTISSKFKIDCLNVSNMTRFIQHMQATKPYDRQSKLTPLLYTSLFLILTMMYGLILASCISAGLETIHFSLLTLFCICISTLHSAQILHFDSNNITHMLNLGYTLFPCVMDLCLITILIFLTILECFSFKRAIFRCYGEQIQLQVRRMFQFCGIHCMLPIVLDIDETSTAEFSPTLASVATLIKQHKIDEFSVKMTNHDAHSDPPQAALSLRDNVCCLTKQVSKFKQAIAFEFKNIFVCPINYTVYRCASLANNDKSAPNLCNWELHGKSTNTTNHKAATLDKVVNNDDLASKTHIKRSVHTQKYFNTFRIMQNGVNLANGNQLAVGRVDICGHVWRKHKQLSWRCHVDQLDKSHVNVDKCHRMHTCITTESLQADKNGIVTFNVYIDKLGAVEGQTQIHQKIGICSAANRGFDQCKQFYGIFYNGADVRITSSVSSYNNVQLNNCDWKFKSDSIITFMLNVKLHTVTIYADTIALAEFEVDELSLSSAHFYGAIQSNTSKSSFYIVEKLMNDQHSHTDATKPHKNDNHTAATSNHLS